VRAHGTVYIEELRFVQIMHGQRTPAGAGLEVLDCSVDRYDGDSMHSQKKTYERERFTPSTQRTATWAVNKSVPENTLRGTV
jgi:hypothetical protein